MAAKPRILIGPMFDDPAESVSAVNRAFVEGLGERYDFIWTEIRRRHGSTRQSAFTFWNLWYFVIQATKWTMNLVLKRPSIAHYAISSGWAMEKSLLLLAIARWTGVRTLGHLHSGGFLDHWSRLPAWRRSRALRELGRLDGFIVLSDWWREQMVEQVGLPKHLVRVVNNPLGREFESAALEMPVNRADCSVLSLGTMGRDKGVHELTRACGILHREKVKFQIQIVGPERDSGVRARVEEEIRREECDLDVVLSHGAFGLEKIELFRQASIFVLPSYYENFPLVVLEAAAAGQAIITTPVGALPEFFQDGISAVFVNPGDSNQLAAALRRLLANPQMRERLGSAARRVFRERLSRNSILDSLSLTYEAVLLVPSPSAKFNSELTN